MDFIRFKIPNKTAIIIAISVLLLIFIFGFKIALINRDRANDILADYSIATAEINSTSIITRKTGSGNSYSSRYVVSYKYEVSGKTYHGTYEADSPSKPGARIEIAYSNIHPGASGRLEDLRNDAGPKNFILIILFGTFMILFIANFERMNDELKRWVEKRTGNDN